MTLKVDVRKKRCSAVRAHERYRQTDDRRICDSKDQNVT